MTDEAFASYYKVWREPIREMARRLAFGDRDLADDLEQEGLCGLAAFDLRTVTGNEEACLHLMLYRRMCNVRRSEMRAARPSRERGASESGRRRPRGRGATVGDRRPRASRALDRPGALRHEPPEREGLVLGVVVTLPRRVPRHWDAAPGPEAW